MQKNGFEKFARIVSRRHKQTTFSDAGFFGILRIKPLGNSTDSSKKQIFFFYFIMNMNDVCTDQNRIIEILI